MRRRGGGRIINFSDWVAKSGRPRYQGFLPYYVAKAGVIALTEALALELAGDKVLVNAIAPGPIVAPPDTTDEELTAVAQATPLGRWWQAIAKAVLALLDNDFITGEAIRGRWATSEMRPIHRNGHEGRRIEPDVFPLCPWCLA